MRRRRRTSPFIREALDRLAELRVEYEDVLLSAYLAAEAATNGAMLNRRGREAGIATERLFRCNRTFAEAYASEELLEHWRSHPRPTFTEYQRQRFDRSEWAA